MKRFSLFALFMLLAVTICFAQKPVRTPAPDVPPTWSQLLPASERFVLVMNDEAVLDKETGLVWERSPSTDQIAATNYYHVVAHCANLEVGGRKGWRVPDSAELASLIDPQAVAPKLPSGHPFLNIQSAVYDVLVPGGILVAGGNHYVVDFGTGTVAAVRPAPDEVTPLYVWCVRGGNTKGQ